MTKQIHTHSNQAGYDLWSEFYDQYPNPTIAVDEQHFPQFWHSLAGKDILEIGCGTGRHTLKLVKQGNRVTGIDLSPEMLAQAKAKLEGMPVTLLVGDILGYHKLQEASFDAVVISLVVEHIENLKELFLKIEKLLRPGGQAYISEIHPERAAAGILAHFKTPSGEKEIHLQSHAHSKAEYAEAVKGARLSVVREAEILGDTDLVNLNPKWSKHLGHPMIHIWVVEKAQ